MFAKDDLVRSARFGIGRIVLDSGATVIARFEHGIEECEVGSLEALRTASQALGMNEWHAPLEVITRIQAEAIQSVNDAWGVLSRSRIALLPHQLWVCRKVIESLPTRWLVADDVGLGKTIEAGLILWPLLARGDVSRLLIVCPASLVAQWQLRLKGMFDIRLAQYVPEADTANSDFWHTHPQVVASLHTLRLDRHERHSRLLEAPPWDIVLVDEAHHLNADEEAGPTLGYKLFERLVEEKRVKSMVFFSGTPHRGKDFGFLSLLKLLRPDLFDPRRPLIQQLADLRRVVIRNNKQNVTDLRGQRLFQPLVNTPETYEYSPAESRFYEMLTDFIATGKAYASTLSRNDSRMAMLVLIAMQKLASSSVAAIRRAMQRRLNRIVQGREQLSELQRNRAEYELLEELGDLDAVNWLDEQIVDLSAQLLLMTNEEPRLQQLIAAARAVTEETKINKIMSLVENQFAGRQVLLFTEYKATQSLVMSALIRRFGEGCVTFINGDERAEDVVGANDNTRAVVERREDAADKFNSGQVRFLVSTEAGGEGIDLQERCHSLIHVDLPWNPMRLHQRVGRLNRYGQTRRVEVFTIRNPSTVESRIWDKLNAKIGSIMHSLGRAMDEPEDLLQLVLGMCSPTMFRDLFTEATEIPAEALSQWFDERTAQFGGRDALDTVRSLVGNCATFDFQDVSTRIPRIDLPDLRSFFVAMLEVNRRRAQEENGELSFNTPDAWCEEPGIRAKYAGLIFDRNCRGREAAQRVLGVGHKLVDLAISQAKNSAASLTLVSRRILKSPLIVFKIRDRVTSVAGAVRAVVVGCLVSDDNNCELLRDWELLQVLNGILADRNFRRSVAVGIEVERRIVQAKLDAALATVEAQQPHLDLPFKVPEPTLLAVLLPEVNSNSEAIATEGDSGS
jgi:ERCC4-related helicase